MSKKLLRVLFTIFVVGGVFLIAVKAQTTAAAPIGQAESGPEIETQLLDQIEKDGSAGYLIYFRDKADLSAAAGMAWEARGYYVMNALQQAADTAQANVRAYLDSQGVKYQSFWIDNIISVDESSLAVFKDLQSFSEIESLRAHRTMGLIEPVEEASGQLPGLFTVEPNIAHVGAPGAWALGYTGTGRVVSSIDTGVRYTHQALNAQYRGNLGPGSYNHNYNWFDPYGDHPTSPADDNGHGTHTMGTMVGDDGGANQIGMAPDAKWLACRGCNTSSCSDTALLTCAQFIAAPTDLTGANPDPDMRPDAVNNSWGDCGQSYDDWYQGVVDSWHAVGIYPLFANGNASNCGYTAPPPCNTVGNPGRYGNVTGVGSTGQSNGAYASHSNRGPTDNPDTVNPGGFPSIKPQVAAPGVNIRSSVNSSDTAYQGGWSGTSMSTPHVTALVALIWEAAPCLVGDYAATETLIQDTATPITTGLPGSCSGEGPGQYPNQSTGYGEINALDAVTAAMNMCGPQGSLGGTVTAAAGGAPLEAADIEAVLSITQTYTTQTGPDGTYLFGSLTAGTYDVTASKFGYLPDTAPGVPVVSGTLTTQDFSLVQASSTTVSGVVSDDQTGWPLYAQITIDGAPLDPLWTDPVTGAYSVVLPQGNTYTLTASAWVPGYLPNAVEVTPTGSAMTVNIELTADPINCTAPGYNYGFSAVFSENFATGAPPALPAGWAVVDVNGTSGDWKTSALTVHPSGQQPHSAPNLAYFNSYNASTGHSTRLYRTANLDLSSSTDTSFVFWMYHDTGYTSNADRVQVQVSTDEAVTWNDVGTAINRYDGTVGWKMHTVDLSAYDGVATVRLGVLGVSAYGNDVHIDDLQVGSSSCTPLTGGLVVGEVFDANTSLGLPGAVVSNQLGDTATAQATEDPAVGDAFYTIFAPAGSTTLTASLPASLYGTDTFNPTIVNGTTIWHDFELPAGLLEASPSPLTGSAALGASTTVPLTLVNNGGSPLTYEFTEKDQGFVPAVGEDVLVVAVDTTSATAVEAALVANGFTYLQVAEATFQAMSVDQLLEYTAVFFTGNAAVNGASENKMVAYLDASGQLFLSDNDFGYSRRSAANTFYNTYLQATYKEDDGGTSLTGEGDFTGIDLDISTDPYPDSFTVGAEGTRIYHFSDNDAGGVLVDRASYMAIYIATDFRYITNLAAANALVDEIMTQFAVDVPWLSENPVSGTLDPGANVVVNVTLDATSLGTPGTYLADLKVKNNTPYGTVTVPVEFTVTPPASFGKLEGTVTGLGYCDTDPAPLVGAEVVITGATDTFTVTTDADGYYFQWINATTNPSLDIEVTADEHTPGEALDVALSPGSTVTKNFDLRWLAPCESVTPDSVTETLLLGDTSTQQLTLNNTGAGVLDWTLSEQPAFLHVIDSATPVSTVQTEKAVTLGDTILSGNSKAVSGSATPSAPVAPNSTTITHSTSQTIISGNSVSCNAGGLHADNHYLRTFTLTDFGITQSFTVMNVQVGIEQAVAGSGGTQPAEVRLYTLSGPLLWANLTLLASAPVSVADGELVIINMPVSALVPAGSTLVVDFFTPDGQTAGDSLFAGSNNLGQTAPTYLAAADCGASEPTNVANLGFAGMHLVMNVTGNVGGGSDLVPWLDESPTSGTVPAPGSQDVTLSFDTTVLSQPGDYFADLRFVTNSPASPLVVPVTLTVTAPETYGLLDGTVTSLGYCDANPAPLVGAQVVIDGSTGTFTATTDAAGYYSWWLDENASPITVTVTAPDHTGATVDGVLIVAGETTTVDVDLNWLMPCASTEPTALEVVVPEGKSRTLPLTVNNDGAGVLDFTFSEEPGTPLAGTQESGISDIGDAWETMAPLPAARVFNAVVADDNGYVYVMGGTSDAGGVSPTNTNYRYNTDTNTWDTMAPIPASVMSVDGIFINGKIYIPGDANTANTFVYDVGANTWSTITANGGYSVRSQYQVVAIGTNLYVLGGIAGSASTTEVWVLNTQAGTWSPGVAMQKSRTAFSAEAINGEIFVAGGVLFPGFVPDMTAEKFNGTSWSYIAPVPNGGGAYTRWSYNADGLGDNVLWLAGGRRDADWAVLNHAGYYDPATDTWTDSPAIPTLSQGRVYMEGAVATDGYFYVIGGRNAAGDTIYATNERLLVGVTVSDVPWLSEDPAAGTVPAYSMDEYNITFTALPTLTLGTYTATLNVVSNDPVNDVIPVPVTMHIATVGVNLSPATAAKPGNPGTAVSYDLTVTNTGSNTDTFDVAVTSAWVTNAPATVGPLAAGASTSFVVTVNIPANALAGAHDTAVVEVTSELDPEVSAQAQLTTTVNAVYGVQVTPLAATQTGDPGTTVTYVLTVTNTGNASDTFDVTVTGQTWITNYPPVIGPLAAGASATVNVTVIIPMDTGSISDVATVTFTSQGDNTKSATSVLTTTLGIERFFLPFITKYY